LLLARRGGGRRTPTRVFLKKRREKIENKGVEFLVGLKRREEFEKKALRSCRGEVSFEVPTKLGVNWASWRLRFASHVTSELTGLSIEI
jgi:hypothetical protein